MVKQLPLFENECDAGKKQMLKRKSSAFDAIISEYRDLFDLFTEADLFNEDLKLIADILGLEAAFVLVLKLGGVQLSIPKRGLNRVIERYILKNFDGSNVRALAIKCGVTTTFVYSCINKGDKKK